MAAFRKRRHWAFSLEHLILGFYFSATHYRSCLCSHLSIILVMSHVQRNQSDLNFEYLSNLFRVPALSSEADGALDCRKSVDKTLCFGPSPS